MKVRVIPPTETEVGKACTACAQCAQRTFSSELGICGLQLNNESLHLHEALHMLQDELVVNKLKTKCASRAENNRLGWAKSLRTSRARAADWFMTSRSSDMLAMISLRRMISARSMAISCSSRSISFLVNKKKGGGGLGLFTCPY
jgi:hypothetical protein